MEIQTLAASGQLAMLAKQIESVPDGDWIAEAKYDGWRVIAHITESGVEFYSRTGKRYDDRLPHVSAELVKRFPAGTWLDGEAVALSFDENGKVTNDWHVTQSVLSKHGGSALAMKVSYVVFDLLAHRDIDARELTTVNRRALLETAMEEVNAPVFLSLTMEATQANCNKLIAMGFEGMMLKRSSAPYRATRNGGWFKLKARGSEDVVIMGFDKGRDVGTIVFGQMREGKLVERGRCKRKTFIPANENEIGSVIEVEYSAIMKSGALRHPRLLRRRDDKTATECVWAVD